VIVSGADRANEVVLAVRGEPGGLAHREQHGQPLLAMWDGLRVER
jgi:hypothetical protein